MLNYKGLEQDEGEHDVFVTGRNFHDFSSTFSKGQGYQGFLRKRAGSSLGPKRAICFVQGKT
jgi:hypothetical protein